jgi:hypothetical protein
MSALAMSLIFLAPLDAILFPNEPSPPPWAEWLYQFQLGLSPPVALGRLLPILAPEYNARRLANPWDGNAALLGLGIWALAAAFLWYRVSVRFRKMTSR